MRNDTASRSKAQPFLTERRYTSNPIPTSLNVSGSSNLEDPAAHQLVMAPVEFLDFSSGGTCCQEVSGMGIISSSTCRIFRSRTTLANQNQVRKEEYRFTGRRPCTTTMTNHDSSRWPKHTKPQNGASRPFPQGMLPHGLTKPLSPTKKMYKLSRTMMKREGDRTPLPKEMWIFRKRTMQPLLILLVPMIVIRNETFL